MSGEAQLFKNAALFVNGDRIRRGIDVEWDDTEVKIKKRNSHQVFETYTIEEFVGADEKTQAWDILDARGTRVRLVAQLGCGCRGQLRDYIVASSYSGALGKRK